MTILVAYAPRPEGQVALDKGIEIAKRRQEHLLVVNATPGGAEDMAMASASDAARVERLLEQEGLSAEFKQFGRGKTTVEEISAIVDAQPVSLLVIGLRKRSAVGKAILGSVAHDLLMSIPCPILAVKAPG